MQIDGKIEDLKLIKGDVLVEIETLVNDEVKFNGGTLKIVTDIKDDTTFADEKYMDELAAKIAKDPKDERARREFTKAMGKASVEKEEAQDHNSKQAKRMGRLAKKPIVNDFHSGWDFKCELDCEIGDEVFWDSYYTKEQIEGVEDDKIMEIEGKRYLMVPRNALFCARRNGQYIGLNGHLIGKVLEEKQDGAIYIPTKKETIRVEVIAPPEHYPEYLNPEVWDNTVVKKGDVVYVKNFAAIPLDSTIASDTDYVRVAVKMIIAVENEN